MSERNRPHLDELPAWLEVTEHYQRLNRTSLRALFAQNHHRVDELTAESDGFVLDYSKNLLAKAALRSLVDVANACGIGGAIEAMLSGKSINATEGRSVLHVALRSQPSAPKPRRPSLRP
jgi:glucose-6-phosphate isomerase